VLIRKTFEVLDSKRADLVICEAPNDGHDIMDAALFNQVGSSKMFERVVDEYL
jgi:hypothetical protein